MTPSSRSAVERLRKPVSFTFAIVWVVAALFTVPDGLADGRYEIMELAGFGLLIVAALGRMWSIAFIGGRKNRDLCTTGPYALTRNPLYVFSFIGVIGGCMALQNPLLLVVSAVFFLAFYHLVIRAEERRLAELFGESFEAYCRSVPRFWPRLSLPSAEGEIHLPVRLFLRNLGEVFWFLAAIVIIDAVEWAHLAHEWPVMTLPF